MHLISDDIAAALVSLPQVIPLMEEAFRAHYRGDVDMLPVAIGRGFGEKSAYGVKGGLVRGLNIQGFKVGSYTPSNAGRGLKTHGSTTILLDPETAFPMAMIGAKALSAIRTAALDAIAIKRLSRQNSRTLAIIGTGYQAGWEVAAAFEARPIERVLVWGRDADRARAFASRMAKRHDVPADVVDIEQAVGCADVVITATAAHDPLVMARWVQPGTHISAMGADTAGRQELELGLVANASLYADIVAQSISIGEFQAAFEARLIDRENIMSIGAVIAGDGGRHDDELVTIFDSSGTALQDLVIAKAVLDEALRTGRTVQVDIDL